MRDQYIYTINQKELTIKRRRENEKMKQKKLRKVFGKHHMKSISAVEYLVNRSIIRTTIQLQMEEVVMKENTYHFTLAYSSSVFQKDIIKQISTMG